MAFRYDSGQIRKAVILNDGSLVCEATFARDGILEYRRSDGTLRRELRLPETNQDSKTLTSFGLAPVTIEHPPTLVNADNAPQYKKGMTLPETVYGKGGFVKGSIVLFDSQAIAYAKSRKKVELSAGYTCDVIEKPGIWNGQHYDAIQTNVEVNHIAITEKGRAGSEVKMHLDSADDDIAYQVVKDDSSFEFELVNEGERMAKIRVDSAEYEVSEPVAAVVGSKLERLGRVEQELKQVTDSLADTQEQLDEVSQERDRERGRADAQEICLNNAEVILEGLGYRRDGEGDYFRVDGRSKKFMDMEDEDMEDEDMEDEDMEDEEEMEETYPRKSSKSKSKKTDSAEKRSDTADKKAAGFREMFDAWKEADSLVPGLSTKAEKLDSAITPIDVKRLVVAELKPELKVEGRSDDAIELLYDLLKDGSQATKQDSNPSATRNDFTQELGAVLALSRSTAAQTPAANTAVVDQTSNNYTEPLSLSRQ